MNCQWHERAFLRARSFPMLRRYERILISTILSQTSHVARLLWFFVHGWKLWRLKTDRFDRTKWYSAPAAVKCVFLCVSERRLKRDCFHQLLRNAYEAFGETVLLEWDERPTSFKHKFQKVRVLIGFQRKFQRYAYLLAFSARKKNPISMLVSITHALPCASRASLVKRG